MDQLVEWEVVDNRLMQDRRKLWQQMFSKYLPNHFLTRRDRWTRVFRLIELLLVHGLVGGFRLLDVFFESLFRLQNTIRWSNLEAI